MRIPFVKPIATLGFMQMIVCFLGFMTMAVVMKTKGYPDSVTIGFVSGVEFMRHWGLAYLILPITWILWASWDTENEASRIPPVVHVVCGYVFLGFTGFFWFLQGARAAMTPMMQFMG